MKLTLRIEYVRFVRKGDTRVTELGLTKLGGSSILAFEGPYDPALAGLAGAEIDLSLTPLDDDPSLFRLEIKS